MTKRIQCFFLVITGTEKRYLRRFVFSADSECPENGYHNALSFIGTGDYDPDKAIGDSYSHESGLWPTHCSCGYEFKDSDQWQLTGEPLYRREDTGELFTLKEAPIGAMWYADWYPFKGSDGHSLVVKTPGGEWCVDAPASNCTKPGDNKHRCWVRHGRPPVITVDKNGNTCAAGAGSIAQKNYHGFLRNGFLEQC